MTNFVSISYNGNVKKVALFDGLDTNELKNLLQIIFSLSSKENIVGLLSSDGLVIPITLACRSSNIVPSRGCELLVNESVTSSTNQEKIIYPPEPPKQQQTQQQSLQQQQKSSSISHTPNTNSVQQQNQTTDVQEGQDEWNRSTQVNNEILRFIASLRSQCIINSLQSQALEELLFESSSLLYAAYSVAIAAGDADYLSDICVDLSKMLMKEDGRNFCSAQDDVLQVCDHLFKCSLITENQLLKLRHQVLIRDEDIADIYDSYEQDHNIENMKRSLHALVSKSDESEDDDDEDDDEVDDDEEEDEISVDEYEKQKKGFAIINDSNRLTPDDVIMDMVKNGNINVEEGVILFQLFQAHNKYVIDAYGTFVEDNKVFKFQKTLLRSLNLEKERRKQSSDSVDSEEGYSNNDDDSDSESEDSKNSPYKQIHPSDEIADLEYGDDSMLLNNYNNDSSTQNTQDTEEDEDWDEDDYDDVDGEKTIEYLFNSLEMDNVWKDSIPSKFILTVFAAVHHGLFKKEQARAICDLYEAKYDMILAAWEVYSVQEDVRDFTDTLARVIRDLDFDTKGEVVYDDSEKESLSNADKAKNEMDKLNSQKEQERDEKQNALVAVNEAKRSILQQSLEVLVKQNLTTIAQAQDLMYRFDNEDILVDAAIDSYANDKDVQDFLETLQILSNHSKEEIDEILRNGMLKGTDDLPVKTSNNYSQDDNDDDNEGDDDDEGDEDDEDDEDEDDDDDDDDDEELVSNANGFSSDLTRIVSELFRCQIIDDLSMNTLLTLIRNEDARVMGAYDLYLDMKDVEDFIDSLLRIANIQVKANMAVQAKKVDATDAKMNPFAPQTSSPVRSNPQSPTKTGSSPAKSAQSPVVYPEKDYQDNDTIQSDDNDEDDNEDEDDTSSQNSSEEDSDSEAAVLPRQLTSSDYKALIQILSNSGNIFSNEEVNSLNYLIDVSNKDIVTAFGKYEVQKDVKDLILSLREIVANNHLQEMNDDESDEYGSEVESLEDETDQDEENNNDGLSTSDYKSLIDILRQSGHISTDEMKRLNFLIDNKDTSIKDAFNDYHNDKDVHRLLNSLRNICTSPKFYNNEQNDHDEEVSSESDEDEESSNENTNEEAVGTNNDSIEKKFQVIVESMQLSKYETAALRLAIARGDNGKGSIREALDLFKVKGDVESLKLSLKEISHQIISETIEEDNRRKQHEAEMNKQQESSDDDVVVVSTPADVTDSTESKPVDSTESRPVANNSLLSTPEARDHVFPLLCSELLKSEIFTKSDCDSLISLYSDGWPVINAALDLYDLTGDMLDLVDTLQRVVKTTKV